VSAEQLLRDIERLAGRLPHRGGITDNERLAAEYILERFEESTPLAQKEDFHSTDAYPNLLALYYLDFSVAVAVLAIWWPWIALGYGLVSFLLYMAEFTGFAVMSRFMPHYETQNVSARFPCQAPKRLLIVTANYDSPQVLPWTRPGFIRWLPLCHTLLVCCMVLMLISCAAEGFGVFQGQSGRIDLVARWAGAAILLAAAAALYTGARGANFTPGANNNASGTALLLALAERLRENPLESMEVWLVATGSKEMWLSGMRQLFRGLEVDKASTFFLNVTGIGAGTLRYVTGEGMLHVYPAGRELLGLAKRNALDFDARPMVYRGPPTDALIPLARGYDAMTVMATVEDDMPGNWHQESDTVTQIDAATALRAVDYVDTIMRGLDSAAGPLGGDF